MAIGFGVHASEGVLAAPARRVGGDAVSARRVYPGLETTGVSFFYTRAYKHTDAEMLAANRQTVIADYKVKYGAGTAGTTLSNTHDWEYVGVQSNQTIKYWDFGAKQYRFFGYVHGADLDGDTDIDVTADLATSTDEQVIVAYSNVDLRYLTTPLYSRLLMVEPTQYGKAVQLEFAYAVAMVEVKFYLGANPQGWSHLTNISFAPAVVDPAIPTCAESIVVTYPIAGTTPEKTTETLAVTSSTGASMAALTYDTLTIPYADWQTGLFAVPSESAYVIGETTRYAVLPAPTNPAFVMSLDLEGKHKTATVPAQYMQWKANTHYTYVFKLTADLEIVLEDVLVDNWSVVDKKSTETTW